MACNDLHNSNQHGLGRIGFQAGRADQVLKFGYYVSDLARRESAEVSATVLMSFAALLSLANRHDEARSICDHALNVLNRGAGGTPNPATARR